MPREEKCLIEGCKRGAKCRGLCKSHYNVFAHKLRGEPDPEAFEARAIAAGRIYAPKTRGASSDAFDGI